MFKVGHGARVRDSTPTATPSLLPTNGPSWLGNSSTSSSHYPPPLEVLSGSLHQLRKTLQVDVLHSTNNAVAEKPTDIHAVNQRAQEYLSALQPLCVARSTSAEATRSVERPSSSESQSFGSGLHSLSPLYLWLVESLSAALAHADALEAVASQNVTARRVAAADLFPAVRTQSSYDRVERETPPQSVCSPYTAPSRRSAPSVEYSTSMFCGKRTNSRDDSNDDPASGSAIGAPMQRLKRSYVDGDDTFEMINDYLVLQQLGRGAAGVVSLAVHQHTNRVVAIKSMIVRMRSKGGRTISSLRALSSMWTPNGENVLHPPSSHRPHEQPPAAASLDAPEHRHSQQQPQSTAATPACPPQEVEIDIMRRLQHPNIVQLFEVVDDDDDDAVHLVMEYCHKGPCIRPLPTPAVLQDAFHETRASTPLSMEGRPPLPTTPMQTMTVVRPLHRLLKFSRQTAKALRYIHRYNILHRDIKPDNLLVDEHDNIKVSDFGVSHLTVSFDANIDDVRGDDAFTGCGDAGPVRRRTHTATAAQHTALRGTPAFLAPEVLHDCGAATAASDVWSFGVTLYAMMFGRLPFVGSTLKEQMDAILSAPLTFPPLEEVPEADELNSELYELWVDVVGTLLRRDPIERMTLNQFLRHRFTLGMTNAASPLSGDDSMSTNKSSSGFEPTSSSGAQSEAEGEAASVVAPPPPQPPEGPSSNSPRFARRHVREGDSTANLADSSAHHPPPLASFMKLPELPHSKRSFHRVVVVSDKKRKSLADALNPSHLSDGKQ